MESLFSKKSREKLRITEREALLLTCVLLDLQYKDFSKYLGISIENAKKTSVRLRKKFKVTHTYSILIKILMDALNISSKEELIQFINYSFDKQLEER